MGIDLPTWSLIVIALFGIYLIMQIVITISKLYFRGELFDNIVLIFMIGIVCYLVYKHQVG